MWFDIYGKQTGIKVDEYDFVSVNYKRFMKINELFILANKESLVFYADDLANNGCHTVQKVQARDSCDVGDKEDDDLS